GRIEHQVVRSESASPVAGVVVGQVRLGAARNLCGLLGVQADRGRGLVGRRGLKAQDLVNVGASAGGAGETEFETAGQRSIRRLDVLLGDDGLIGAAVIAVREAQQAVLRDLQFVGDHVRVVARYGAFVGYRGARQDFVGTGNRRVVQYPFGVRGVVKSGRAHIR